MTTNVALATLTILFKDLIPELFHSTRENVLQDLESPARGLPATAFQLWQIPGVWVFAPETDFV